MKNASTQHHHNAMMSVCRLLNVGETMQCYEDVQYGSPNNTVHVVYFSILLMKNRLSCCDNQSI